MLHRRRWAAAAAWALAAACTPPDRPPSLPDPIPPALVELLEPDTARVLRVADGVWYRYLWSARGPWAVHLVEADLGLCRLGLDVSSASDDDAAPGEALGGGRETVSALAADHEGEPLVAVNGDFFTPEGLPLGPEATALRTRPGRGRPGILFRPGAPGPLIGDVGEESGPTASPRRPGAASRIVGGFPELLDRGARVGDLGVEARPAFAASRHPRTAVAHDPIRRRLWLVVVDGRQGAYSTGMSLPELASLLEALGAREALNLDGGGSSVMVVRGHAVSRPSDESGERPVANALLLVDDPALCGTSPALTEGG
jgi:hypothetical protein